MCIVYKEIILENINYLTCFICNMLSSEKNRLSLDKIEWKCERAQVVPGFLAGNTISRIFAPKLKDLLYMPA